MKSDSGKFSSTLHSFHLKLVFVLKSHLNFTKEAFASQWSHSSPGALLSAKQELTGWKWIPWFQRKGCGIFGEQI